VVEDSELHSNAHMLLIRLSEHNLIRGKQNIYLCTYLFIDAAASEIQRLPHNAIGSGCIQIVVNKISLLPFEHLDEQLFPGSYSSKQLCNKSFIIFITPNEGEVEGTHFGVVGKPIPIS